MHACMYGWRVFHNDTFAIAAAAVRLRHVPHAAASAIGCLWCAWFGSYFAAAAAVVTASFWWQTQFLLPSLANVATPLVVKVSKKFFFLPFLAVAEKFYFALAAYQVA